METSVSEYYNDCVMKMMAPSSLNESLLLLVQHGPGTGASDKVINDLLNWGANSRYCGTITIPFVSLGISTLKHLYLRRIIKLYLAKFETIFRFIQAYANSNDRAALTAKWESLRIWYLGNRTNHFSLKTIVCLKINSILKRDVSRKLEQLYLAQQLPLKLACDVANVFT